MLTPPTTVRTGVSQVSQKSPCSSGAVSEELSCASLKRRSKGRSLPDACGLYDFPNVTLAHAGRTDPVGQITLLSSRGNLNIRGGSGMLLRVNDAKP